LTYGSHKPQSQPLDLAAIGNCRVAALINSGGRIVWWCFPRLDADPIFSRLLAGNDETGFCDVVLHDLATVSTTYRRNTAIVDTVLKDSAGNSVRITDYVPRFRRFDRIYHPPQLFRRIEPISGLPRVTIRVRPTFNYGGACTSTVLGSNHIRYSGGDGVLRLTTDAPLSYIVQEAAFALTRPVTLVFGSDEPLETSVEHISRDFLERTQDYWYEWVRSLGVPLDWQSDVIRAAISLKLCSFEETGAVIAALTTSIPEAPGSQRTWDYRYCWPRDAYFVIKALNQLGATQTMESYLNYITSLAVDVDRPMRPVYGIVHDQSLAETIAPDLKGFAGFGPVRIGNQAAEQSQHDTYGSIILAASQMFIDERLPHMGDVALFRRLETLGEHAKRLVAEPDAGLWEYRGRKRIHTHSATMCWVACDRLARIAGRLSLPDRMRYWRTHANRLKVEILSHAWNSKRGAIVAAFDHDDLDASVLLLPELGLISASDPRYVKTVELIGTELQRNGYMMRYTAADDFGSPEVAFVVCQFWYIDALGSIGQRQQAREMLTGLLARRNSFGILSEDIHPLTHQLWGNLPQTYPMAGIINSAMGLSRPWDNAWAEADGTFEVAKR
jgi:GH15 family glucan-1,4-alpha-glucosidase